MSQWANRRESGRAVRAARVCRPVVEGVESRVLLSGTRVFTAGDVLIGVEGKVLWWDDWGNRIGELATGPGINAGMAFDGQGNLYVTRFTAGEVLKFDVTGQPLGRFGVDQGGNNPLEGQLPETIAFDAAGRAYVGTAQGRKDVYQFDAGGNLLKAFDVPTDVKGSDWLAIHPDQKTLYYTSEGTEVLRYDLQADQPLSTFATGLLPRSFALEFLPDGGMIVANRNAGTDPVMRSWIQRLDVSGNLTQTYDVGANDDGNRWFALSLAEDGRSFWAGDDGIGPLGGTVAKFDVASGQQLMTPMNAGGRVFGLAVVDATASPPPPVTRVSDVVTTVDGPSSVQVGELLSYVITVRNDGPDSSSNVVLSHQLPVDSDVMLVSMGQVDGAGLLEVDLGELAMGQAQSLTVLVRPKVSQLIEARAEAVASTDRDMLNNVASLTVKVEPARGVDGVAVQVMSVRRRGVHGQPTRVVIRLSGEIDPGAAVDVSNYRVEPMGGTSFRGGVARLRSRASVAIPVRSVVYDAEAKTVTLDMRTRLAFRRPYQLTVSDAVSDMAGRKLDGNGDGEPGGDFVSRLLGFRGERM